jgi:hypothetical protein
MLGIVERRVFEEFKEHSLVKVFQSSRRRQAPKIKAYILTDSQVSFGAEDISFWSDTGRQN